jgi:hypothetical protein
MTELIERDWAGVPRARCDDCGFDARGMKEREFAAAIRALGERWVVFADACRRDAEEHPRANADVQVAVELACHVREGLAVFAQRIERVLAEDRPALGLWAYEHSHAVGGVHESLHAVATDIGVNASEIADVLKAVTRDGWMRRGSVAGREYTVAGLARFALHEGSHHLIEAEQAVLARL